MFYLPWDCKLKRTDLEKFSWRIDWQWRHNMQVDWCWGRTWGSSQQRSWRCVFKSLSLLNVMKAVGPDNIPNKVFKDFPHKLAPVIQNISSQSFKEGYIPLLLKSSIVTPAPKATPPRQNIGRSLPHMAHVYTGKSHAGIHVQSCNKILRVETTWQQMLFYSCYKLFMRQ